MAPLVALLDDDFGGGAEGAEGGRDERNEEDHGRAACSRSTGTDTDTDRRTDPETGPPTTARSTSTRRCSTCNRNNSSFDIAAKKIRLGFSLI